jgi:CO/xanthine dehydrogenase FAD-binding subunit
MKDPLRRRGIFCYILIIEKNRRWCLRYYCPADGREALEILRELGACARILAGGTDVVVAMKEGRIGEDSLVDISRLSSLGEIACSDGAVTVGSLVTHCEASESSILHELAEPLALACASVGSPQIRNRATIGGNVCHASPAGDSIPALMALGAEAHLESLEGSRWVHMDEFFLGPGKTVRQAHELLTGFRFRALARSDVRFFLKLGQRKSLAIAKVSVAGALSMAGDTVADAAIALGAVAPMVVRAPEAEEYLKGRKLDAQTVAHAADLAAKVATPIDDVRSNAGYRREMVTVLVRRGLFRGRA